MWNNRSKGRIRTIVVQGYILHHLPLKVLCSIFIVGIVRYHQFESHAYRRILLSVSSRAANYAPHRLTMLHGELSATSPAHHRMAINHLLHRLDMMCFLALGATSYLTKYENLRSDTIPDFFIGLCCVRVWLILKESVVAPICPLHWKGSP